MIQIRLTQGLVALIDDVDRDLAEHTWSAKPTNRAVYAITQIRVDDKQKPLSLHRVIMERKLERPIQPQEIVDHIDGNGLNNSRSNLRIATNSQNMCNRNAPVSNTTGVKGVYWRKGAGKWEASIKHLGKRTYLGLFTSIQDAAIAYNKKAIELHGEFARLNVVEGSQDGQ
jgi:hypothetical protein